MWMKRKKGLRKITKPRPGHADLVGGARKYRFDDLRNSLERSSARETTHACSSRSGSQALVGGNRGRGGQPYRNLWGIDIDVPDDLTVAEIKERAAQSEVSIVNPEREEEIKAYIDQIKKDGDTIGGVIETVVGGVPVGLGSYVQWDKKLDAKIAQGVVSINALRELSLVWALKPAVSRAVKSWMKSSWSEEDGFTS